MNNKIVKLAIQNSNSWSEVCRKLFGAKSSYRIKKLKELNKWLNVSTDHFVNRTKYEVVTKVCPVCTKSFKTKKDHPKEKITCSHSCSNTYFKTNPSAVNTNYRKRALKHYGAKCKYCGDTRKYVLQVHHIDQNRKNNKLENLEVLCANCHLEVHYLKK